MARIYLVRLSSRASDRHFSTDETGPKDGARPPGRYVATAKVGYLSLLTYLARERVAGLDCLEAGLRQSSSSRVNPRQCMPTNDDMTDQDIAMIATHRCRGFGATRNHLEICYTGKVSRQYINLVQQGLDTRMIWSVPNFGVPCGRGECKSGHNFAENLLTIHRNFNNCNVSL